MSELGVQFKKFPKGTCFLNKGKKTEEEQTTCARPCPDLLAPNLPFWRFWQDALEGVSWRGMEGDPGGIPPTEVEAAARANGIAWPAASSLVRYRIVKQRWLLDTVARFEERAKELRKKAAAAPAPAGRRRR